MSKYKKKKRVRYNPNEPSDGPSRRVKAFLTERVQMPAETVEESAAIGRRGAKKATPPPANAAAYRLRALLQSREVENLPPGGDPKPGTRAKRDPLPAPGVAGGYWLPIGPFGVRKGQAPGDPVISGRVSRLGFSPDGRRVYLATANSGVWVSEDKGRSWTSLMGPDFDKDPLSMSSNSLSCGAIAVVRDAGTGLDRIYVGTGEGDAGDYGSGGTGSGLGYFGVGPIISKDGGKNWLQEPSSIDTPGIPFSGLTGQAFFEMALHPDDPEMVIAATSAGVFRREKVAPASADYRWVQLTNFKATAAAVGATPTFCTSVVVAKQGATVAFFAFVIIGATKGVYRSTNNGAEWVLLTATGFPPANQVHRNGRVGVSAGNPNVVYALLPSSGIAGTPKAARFLGLYRWESTDTQWRKVDGVPDTLFGPDPQKGGQGHYDNCIVVDPQNPNRVFVGGSTVWTNIDGDINPLFGEWAAAIYRCLVSVSKKPDNTVLGVSANATYIGTGVHSDVHALAFPPGNPQDLWVACDGGVFQTEWPDGSGMVFRPRNHGLQTMTMNYMDLHPTEDHILFCGTQDNGGQVYNGKESWMVVSLGDCGYCVVNWHDPKKVLDTYTNTTINRSTDYGNRDSFGRSSPGTDSNDVSLFYAPLVGTPPGAGGADAADHVACGSQRLWLSENFGRSWKSIPNNDFAQDATTASIRAIAFASPTKIYAGNEAGDVYRYEKKDNQWSRFLMTPAPAPAFQPNRVTAIAIDPSDATGDSIYVAIGGILGNANHVWHGRYQPGSAPGVAPVVAPSTTWTPQGGPAAATRLPDVQHNALAIDPVSRVIYVGNDLGVWKATPKAVLEWEKYSQGLPDAAVIDLKIKGKLLRAATHGRGVFERQTDYVGVPIPVKLYVRSTELDAGERKKNTDGLAYPFNPSQKASILESPDIRVEAPNQDGSFRSSTDVDFIEFSETVRDDNERVPAHPISRVRSRVYVRIHNKGTGNASDTRATLLIANSTSGVPALPAEHINAITNGLPYNNAQWKTVGIQTVRNLRIGNPQVLCFELSASLLPAFADVSGDTRCVLAVILHHPDDAYTGVPRTTGGGFESDIKKIAEQRHHLALRQIKIVRYDGQVPPTFPYRALPGFAAIPSSATTLKASFDSFLGAALRNNDNFFDRHFAKLLLWSLANNGQDGNALPAPDALAFSKKIEITALVSTVARTPLIWCAQESITIKAKIDASGKGALPDTAGDFGGSGGGSGNKASQPCAVPVSGARILDGADQGANGKATDKTRAMRAFTCLNFSKGGGGGANDGGTPGGAGGGIVVLCAPSIKFEAGAMIDVSGLKGNGNSGGGGGGLIILIANEFPGYNENTHTNVAGGAKSGTSGIGGTGLVLKLQYS